MVELLLLVNGLAYGGWKNVRVTRSIESLAGSFDLDVSDRWGDREEIWPIVEEDECRAVIVDMDKGTKTTVIDGFIDHRRLGLTAETRTLSYQGRDRAAALVDSSALLGKFSFAQSNVIDISRKLAAQFGITVTTQPGLTTTKHGLVSKSKTGGKIVINPGDSPYSVMQRAAAEEGVLLVSDGKGGVLITQAGTARMSTALVEGRNIKEASVEYDATTRYHRYVIGTQTSGSDWISGKTISGIHAEAIDTGVRRTERVLFIRPEKGLSIEVARARADWEARVRAARAEKVSITVVGWTVDGEVWPLNKLITVHSPSIGVDGDMLIAHVEHTDGPGGELTQLGLVRPDAFLPEPHTARVGGSGLWKELEPGKGGATKAHARVKEETE